MNDLAVLSIVIAVAAVAILIVAAVAMKRRARARTLELRRQFGPEYDRAVQDMGSPARAERELSARARRVEHLKFRELSAADRARFAAAWTGIQAQFVDDPAIAVASANELIKDVMRARGYPTHDFEQRAADLSVAHPAVVQHYRAAKALADGNRSGQLNTEDLRQAIVHYRFLFTELLQEPSLPTGALHNVHA